MVVVVVGSPCGCCGCCCRCGCFAVFGCLGAGVTEFFGCLGTGLLCVVPNDPPRGLAPLGPLVLGRAPSGLKGISSGVSAIVVASLSAFSSIPSFSVFVLRGSGSGPPAAASAGLSIFVIRGGGILPKRPVATVDWGGGFVKLLPSFACGPPGGDDVVVDVVLLATPLEPLPKPLSLAAAAPLVEACLADGRGGGGAEVLVVAVLGAGRWGAVLASLAAGRGSAPPGFIGCSCGGGSVASVASPPFDLPCGTMP
mmetsp:Transcript_24604/g.37905  ORF Transcript_24604/g.37905 Transcript_24604/m.37905 type:complete len:254 (+) Transcript_24604:774-1535(+)